MGKFVPSDAELDEMFNPAVALKDRAQQKVYDILRLKTRHLATEARNLLPKGDPTMEYLEHLEESLQVLVRAVRMDARTARPVQADPVQGKPLRANNRKKKESKNADATGLHPVPPGPAGGGGGDNPAGATGATGEGAATGD